MVITIAFAKATSSLESAAACSHGSINPSSALLDPGLPVPWNGKRTMWVHCGLSYRHEDDGEH